MTQEQNTMTAIEQAIEALSLAQRFVQDSKWNGAYTACGEAIAALQSMQGEAVGWYKPFGNDPEHALIPLNDFPEEDALRHGWQKVYTHPQSPAVPEVPKRMTISNVPDQYIDDIDFAETYEDGWNDCRDAMLSAAKGE